MISKLKKLRGRSLAELVDRGRQAAAVLAGRAGIDKKPVSDTEFLVSLGTGAATADELLSYVRTRGFANFYPSFGDLKETIETLRARFPEESELIITSAEKICIGRFDLLGYTNLDFGAPVPDWHLEPVSGKRSPRKHWSEFDELDTAETGDKKVTWELNRHQYFSVLGRAYALSGDEGYAETFASHVDDWLKENPYGVGVNWVSSLEIAFRLISWVWALAFFVDSRHLSGDLLLRMLRCMEHGGRHIETHLSTYSSPNTHLTGEALGLYMLGLCFPEFPAADRWKRRGYAILLEELDKQVRDDGGHVEQSSHYLRYTLDFYLTLLVLRKYAGESVADVHISKLRKMLDLLGFLTQPDGRLPLIGDDDGGRLHFLDERSIDDPRSTIAAGVVLLNDARFRLSAGAATAELLWVTGVDGLQLFDEMEPIPPSAMRRWFDKSGYFCYRSAWDERAVHCVVDCGEHGFLNGAHAHADALSFVLSVGSFRVFVDPGTYTYTADPEARDLFRSSAAHNCVTINSRSSSEPAGPFAWKKRASCTLRELIEGSESVIFQGSHDGFRPLGVDYDRRMEFLASGPIIVTDSFKTRASNSFEVGFMLDPMIDVDQRCALKLHLRSKEGNRSVLTIDTILADDLECLGWKVARTKISPVYGAAIDTLRISLTVTADREFQMVNRIVPSEVGI